MGEQSAGRGRSARLVRLVVLAVLLTSWMGSLAALPAGATVIQDGFNTGATPDFLSWGLDEVGWYWTADTSFNLVGIETNFRAGVGLDRLVTVELLNDRGAVGGGGVVLDSGTFSSAIARNTLGGVIFGSPFPVVAGITYFVGFQNVLDLGINVVGAFPINETNQKSDADSGYGDAVPNNQFALRFSIAPQFDFTCAALDCPIIAFLANPTSTAPEPGTLILLSAGLVGLGGISWKRNRRK